MAGDAFITPVWMAWATIAFIFILMGLIAWLIMKKWQEQKLDTVIFIDESNRWSIDKTDLRSRSRYNVGKKTYLLTEKAGLLNSNGKALYIFSKNRPTPMAISYNSTKWIDAESLMATINNEFIKMMVNPSGSMKDMLVMLGAIGGMIAGIASVILLAKQMGLF